MGRNSYYGGSSILYSSGGFSTLDPAARPKNKVLSRGKSKAQRKTSKPSKPSKPAKQKQAPRKRSEAGVLHDVISAMVLGRDVSAKNIEPSVIKAIEEAGGPVEWARRHPHHDKVWKQVSEDAARKKTSEANDALVRAIADRFIEPAALKAAMAAVPQSTIQAIAEAGGPGKWAERQPRFRKYRMAALRAKMQRDQTERNQLKQIGVTDAGKTAYFYRMLGWFNHNFQAGRSEVHLMSKMNSAGFRTATGGLWTRRLVELALTHIREHAPDTRGGRAAKVKTAGRLLSVPASALPRPRR